MSCTIGGALPSHYREKTLILVMCLFTFTRTTRGWRGERLLIVTGWRRAAAPEEPPDGRGPTTPRHSRPRSTNRRSTSPHAPLGAWLGGVAINLARMGLHGLAWGRCWRSSAWQFPSWRRRKLARRRLTAGTRSSGAKCRGTCGRAGGKAPLNTRRCCTPGPLPMPSAAW